MGRDRKSANPEADIKSERLSRDLTIRLGRMRMYNDTSSFVHIPDHET